MKMLYKLTTNHPYALHVTDKWKCGEIGKMICPRCEAIDRSWYPRSVDIGLKYYPDYRISGPACFVGGIEVFHIKFIDLIQPYINSFILGKCLLPDGQVVKEYVTCYTKRFIVTRGNKDSTYCYCNECGRMCSSPRESEYTLRSYLTDSLVYQDCNGYLFLDESIALKIDISPWPDAELQPVQILDEPLDEQHLPCDPPYIVEKYPQNYWKYVLDFETVEKIRNNFCASNEKACHAK